jgi:hypothetical protein
MRTLEKIYKNRVCILRKQNKMHKIHHLHTGSAVSILEKVGPTVHLSKEANEYNHISPERRGSKLGAMVYNSSSS